MKTYIALFRGINVGGRNLLPMRGLVQALEDLGLHKIRTYIQSGNVVFKSEEDKIANLLESIRAVINTSHGFAPQVILLELEELEKAVTINPFREAETEPKSLHLYFLTAVPTNPDLKKLESIKGESERFALKGKVFYLHAPDGIGRSKLATRAETSLGVAVTARNWRSVGRILALAQQLD